MSSPPDKRDKILISLIAILHLFITVPLAKILNIWLDEAYTLHTTGHGVSYALRQSLNFEFQPPLYFVTLSIWRTPNDSIFFSRLFSILCILLTILITEHLSKALVPKLRPVWTVLLVAFNPFVIWAALEIRAYALVLLFSSILLLSFFQGYLSATPKPNARRFYTAFAVLSLYTMYHLGFLLAIQGIFLLCLRRKRLLKYYIKDMAIVALIFSPLIWFIRIQVLQQNMIFMTNETTVINGFLTTARHFQWLFFGSWPKTHLLWNPWNLVIKPLIVVSAISMAAIKRRSLTRNHLYLGMISIIGYLTFSFLRAFTEMQYALELRHALIFLLSIIFFVFSIFSIVGKSKNVVVLIITFSVLLSYSIAISYDYRSMAKPGDWSNVAYGLMNYETVGQPIVVFPPDLAWPLSHYYHGKNAIVQIPRELDPDNYDPREFALGDLISVHRILSSIDRGYGFWLVVDCPTESHILGGLNRRVLEEVLADHFEVEISLKFNGTLVRLVRKIELGPTLPSRAPR
jgi:uncharacterized membrane protein